MMSSNENMALHPGLIVVLRASLLLHDNHHFSCNFSVIPWNTIVILSPSPNFQAVSPSAQRSVLPPLVSLLIHSPLFSLYLVLRVVGLSPSLFWSQALFYYKCTYSSTFIFHSKKVWGKWLIKPTLWGKCDWRVLYILSFPLTLFYLIP